LLLFARYKQNVKVEEDEMNKECSRNEEEEEFIDDIGVKARRKETTTKTTHGWVDNVIADLTEIVWDGTDGIIWLRIVTNGGLL
jgi:hypothetical protein